MTNTQFRWFDYSRSINEYFMSDCFVVKPNNAVIIDKTFEYGGDVRVVKIESLEWQSGDHWAKLSANLISFYHQENCDTKSVRITRLSSEFHLSQKTEPKCSMIFNISFSQSVVLINNLSWYKWLALIRIKQDSRISGNARLSYHTKILWRSGSVTSRRSAEEEEN